MKAFIVFYILLSIFSGAYAADLKRDVQSITQSLETINKDPFCNTQQKRCPKVLKDLVGTDGESKFFGLIKHENEVCEKFVQNDKNSRVFKTPYALAQQLASYQAKGSVSADSFAIDNCLEDDSVKSKNGVSKYFYYHARLQHAQFRQLEEIAEIDQVLNKDHIYKDFICAGIPYENNRRRCEELKKSCVVSSLDKLTDEIKDDLAKISQLEQEMKDMKKKLHALKAKGELPADMKKVANEYQVKKLSAELIKSRSPVLSGEIFQKGKDKNLKEAIRNQLEANRKIMLKNLSTTTEIHKCLVGSSHSKTCDAEKIRDYIQNETSPLEIPEFDISQGKTREESLGGYNYMSYQQCLHDRKVSQVETNELVTNSAFYSGLSLVSMGSAGIAGAVVAGGSRLVPMARAVSSVREAQILRAAKALKIGADATIFGASMKDAISVCSNVTEKLQGETKASKACENGTTVSTRGLVKNYDECVMGLVFAAMGAVPGSTDLKRFKYASKTDELLAKSGATRADLELEKTAIKNGQLSTARKNIVSANAALDDAARAKKISADFRNLSKKQVDCIVKKVHTIGKGKGVYHYSESDIFKKARTLRRTCKVGHEDMRALLQLGYAGELPPSTSDDFAKLLNMGVARTPAATIPIQSVDEMKGTITQLNDDLTKTTDPLKRIQIKDEIKSLERQVIDETLAQNPSILDDVLAKSRSLTSSTSPTRIGSQNSIKISAQKSAQLDKEGISTFDQMLIEIKPGDEVYFKSFSFGNGMARVRKTDPENPGHIEVEIFNADTKKMRVVSMPQTEIAMTDKEKAEVFRLLTEPTRESQKSFLEILNRPYNALNVDRMAEEIAKNVGRTPAKKEADELGLEIQDLQRKHKDSLGLMTDPEYVRVAKRYQELTRLNPKEDQVLRALSEIDFNKPKPSPEDLKVLNEAKKIRDTKSEVDLPQDVRSMLKNVELVEKQLATSSQRFQSRRTVDLQRINDSSSFGRRYDYPSQTEFQKAFAPNSPALSIYEKQDYKAMEKLFTEDPQSLSDESRKWLQRSGSAFLKKYSNGSSENPTRDYFLKRLQIYDDIERAR